MRVQRLLLVICLLFIACIPLQPLFSSGFFPMHDDAQVARVVVMTNALNHGQFPVRMVSDLGYGYGYPLFNFYGPLPYYIGAGFHLFGFDALTATKIMMGFGFLIGSVGVFLFTSHLFGVFGGIFSSILFTFFPYRAVQLYVRGSIGELWAVSLLPFLLYGLILLMSDKTRLKGVWIGALSLSFIILSHTVFGYLSVVALIALIIIVWCISHLWRKKGFQFPFLSTVVMIILSLGATAFFWLPALGEMNITNVEKVIGASARYQDHFICLEQLWNSPWGYGGSANGCMDGMSFKLGKIQCLIFFVACVLLWLKKDIDTRVRIYTVLMVGLTVFFLFLTLPWSAPIWYGVPLASYIQYPWRFLGLIGVFMTCASGILLYRLNKFASWILIGTIGMMLVLTSGKMFTPQYLYPVTTGQFEQVQDLRFRASKVSDEYLPKGIFIPQEERYVERDRVQGNSIVNITKISESEIEGSYQIIAYNNTELKLNMAYYPGWKFFINGKEIKPNIVDGQPYVVLSAGESHLKMKFVNTRLRLIANWISVLTCIGICGYLLYGKKAISQLDHSGI